MPQHSQLSQPLRILSAIVLIGSLIGFRYWLDYNDYFHTNYHDLTQAQKALFQWHEGDLNEEIVTRYAQHFADTALFFPRQQVASVRIFKNFQMLGGMNGKLLKKEETQNFINFCNAPVNFDWGETTWQTSESEYFCRIYNNENEVVGKTYFCLVGCSMTKSRPFCPAMKFGMLSAAGRSKLEAMIADKAKWE